VYFLLEAPLGESNSGPESTAHYSFARNPLERRRSDVFHEYISIPSDPRDVDYPLARSLKNTGANFMSQASDRIQIMRDQQLTRGMKALAILGFFALLASLSRAFIIGWQFVMYVHVSLYLIILAVVFLKRRLSFYFTASTIVILLFVLGVTGLVAWGLMSFGLVSLFSFCILATILFGSRMGLVASMFSLAAIGIIGGCVHTGIIAFRFNLEAFLTSPASWLTAIFAIALSAGIMVLTLGTAQAQTEELAETLEKQNEELLQANQLLKCEIAERVRAEEERQKYENRLRNAEKTEAIGVLAGGVAHDLNNILGGIVGYPELLLEDLPIESPLRDKVEAIRKLGIKAAAIVNDMLTLARRRIEFTEVVDLNSVVLDYCSSLEFDTLKKYHPLVEIEIRTDPNLMNICGLHFHMSKVIMNLVSNAAEAMPDGGKILITTENREIGEEQSSSEEIKKGKYSVLSVSDTGIGIPAEDLQRIFEPFYSKKKMGRSGTGLGMAVVWGTVTDYKGYIDIDSVEGKGTTFTLYIPSTEEQVAPARPPMPKTELRGRGESILIVDDAEEQREMASNILQELGYSVRTLGSGEEAIDYLNRATVDLLILDMLMEPGMDGLETYRKIAEIHPGQKAIITTGYAETTRIKEALQAGVGCYLKKPYRIDEIGLAVKAVLENQVNGHNKLSSQGLVGQSAIS
jgi:signal transduction histidine kinase/ActR/RegA family two-component response regulator